MNKKKYILENKAVNHLNFLIDKHWNTIEKQIEEHTLPMHLFFIEEMNQQVAGFKKVKDTLYENMNIAFAVKSNPCRGAIRNAARLSMGVDSASEYEFQTAIEEGIFAEDITCNGNAKTNKYLEIATRNGSLIIIDNMDEQETLEEICSNLNMVAKVLIRFSGMPLTGFTAADQSTASEWTKFGFHINEAKILFENIKQSKWLNFQGLSAHIGTQLYQPNGYLKLFEYMFELTELANTYNLEVKELNIGGGFPVEFLDDLNAIKFQDELYANVIHPNRGDEAITWNELSYGFSHLKCDSSIKEKVWKGKAYWTKLPGYKMLEYILQANLTNAKTPLEMLHKYKLPRLIVEPGRSIMAPSGITLCEVMGTKKVLEHNVVILNLGINNHSTNLITPDLFQAAVLPFKEDDSMTVAFLAGRLCFSGDMISKNKVTLNRLPKRGELFVIYSTGGYSADHFASHSCGYPLPAKVAIMDDGGVEVWRKAGKFRDVFCAI